MSLLVQASVENSTLEARLLELEAKFAQHEVEQRHRANGITIIAFSGDMDKLLAAFTLATGAAAMGLRVSIFFTFWALLALKQRSVFKGKRGIDWLMTAMMPAGPSQLGVSKWNVLGLGRLFFENRMRQQQVANLEQLMALAREMNVRLIACETSMQMMAVSESELVEGVQYGGAAACLDEALNGSITLFV